MDLGIRDKVALIAASSKGLGRAVAEELAQEGAKLVMCARGENELHETASLIRDRSGVDVETIACDVSTLEGVRAVVDAGLTRFGSVDILVTNAGGPPAGTFDSLPREKWDLAYNLTLMSTVELCRAALPSMRERKWGRILNITSISAKQPVEGLLLSNVYRPAITGFARTLATEIAQEGVTVNNILPGYTYTGRVQELAEAMAKDKGTTADEVMASRLGEIPMRRMGDVREFAALAAFLVSDRAGYITGASVTVDGGWVRSLF